MAVTPNSVVLPQAPRLEPQNFVQGTDSPSALKTIFTPGANGAKVVSIMAASNDGTAAHLFAIYLTRSTIDYLLGTVNIPIYSGSNGAAPHIDVLKGGPSELIPGLPVDNDGQTYLLLQNGDVLKATYSTALTSGKRLDVVTVGSDF